jgi:TolB-like protein
MKKFLCTAFLVFTAALVFSQQQPVVAVFPFEDMDNVLTRSASVMFYREFSNEFTNKMPDRSVVPRLDVDRLINFEMDFQLTVFSAQEKTAEMMRVQNATQILSGYIARVDNDIRITVSLFAYPNLQQLPGGAAKSVSNITELFNIIPELVQIMIDNLPPPNPFIGRWRSTITSNGLTLVCVLNLGDTGLITVEQYDTNRVTQHLEGVRYSNDRRRGRGNGTYSIRNSGNTVIADISLTLSGVSHEFSAITTQARFSAGDPNKFTIYSRDKQVDSMKCEFYVTNGRINDSYREFHKL